MTGIDITEEVTEGFGIYWDKKGAGVSHQMFIVKSNMIQFTLSYLRVKHEWEEEAGEAVCDPLQ